MLQWCLHMSCTDLLAGEISNATFAEVVTKVCVEDSKSMSIIIGYQPASYVMEVSMFSS